MKQPIIILLFAMLTFSLPATSMQNNSSLPVHIGSFTLKMHTGLNTTVVIEKIGRSIAPGQIVRIEDLIHQPSTTIEALDITVGNNRYHLTITPHVSEGTIVIQKDGTLTYGPPIMLLETEEIIPHHRNLNGPYIV